MIHPPANHVLVTVFLVKDDADVDAVLSPKAVRGTTTRLSTSSQLFFGPTRPQWLVSWLEGFAGEDQAIDSYQDRTVSPDEDGDGSAILLHELGTCRFAVTVGIGESLISKHAVQSKFGVRLAMGMMGMVVEGQPNTTRGDEHGKRRNRDAANPSTCPGQVHVMYAQHVDTLNCLDGRPRHEFNDTVGTWIRGEDGLTFNSRADVDIIVQNISVLADFHDSLVLTQPHDSPPVAAREQATNGGMANGTPKQVAPRHTRNLDFEFDRNNYLPTSTEMLPHLLRQIIVMNEPVGPGKLYGPVASSLGMPFMSPLYMGKAINKRLFKKTLRSSLKVLMEAGLADRVQLGRYRPTALGLEVSARHLQFSEDLINSLYMRQMTITGDLERLNGRNMNRSQSHYAI